MKKRLSSLTVKELRALAAEMGIRPIAARKAAIVQQITRALGESQSLYSMTVLQLRAYARAAGVKLKSTRKDAIIAELINKAQQPSPSKDQKKPAAKPRPHAGGLMKRARPEGSVELSSSKRWQSLGNGSTPGPHPVIGASPPSAPDAEATKPSLTISRRLVPAPVGHKQPSPEAPEALSEAPQALSEDAPSGSVLALAVEPYRLFAAWEITEHRLLRGDLVVKLFDMSGEPFLVSETPVHLSFGGVFIQTQPGRICMLELGESTIDGSYRPLKHSALFRTPADGPSEEGASILPESHFTGWRPSGSSPGV